MGYPLLALAAAFIAAGTVACRPGFRANTSAQQPAILVPSKDEIARVSGVPISLSSFLALRNQYPKQKPTETFQLATEAIVLQLNAKTRQVGLSIGDAIQIARFSREEIPLSEAETALKQYYGNTGALPVPHEVKTEIRRLLEQAVIVHNPALASSFQNQ